MPERTVIARDGSTLQLRPLGPDDKSLLADAMARLSPESRYRRFFGPHEELTERELAYLTEIDHHDHEAVVAIEPGSGQAVGVARFVRLGTDPHKAEAAVAVVDDWHRRGVARVLLELLSERACEEGVDHFVALVQAENQRALSTLSALGPTKRERQSGVVELNIALAPEGLGAPLESALRAAAGELVGTAPLGDRIRRKALELWQGRTAPVADPPRARAPVLVGVGETPVARAALSAAAELAEATGAGLHLVAGYRGEENRRVAEARLREAVASLAEERPPVVVHPREGGAAEAMLALAEELSPGLVVVWAAEDGRMGAVAPRVLRRARYHVLIVR